MKAAQHFASKYVSILLLTLIFLPFAASAQTGFSVKSDSDTEDNELYSINLQTGVATSIGATGFVDIECLTFNLSGDTLYAVSDETDELLTCNPGTGACTSVGPLNVVLGGAGVQCGLAFDCNGNLFMSLGIASDENFFSIDPETGQATLIGDQGQEVTGLTARLGDETCPSGVFGLGIGDAPEDASLGCMDIISGAYIEIGPLINEDLFCGGIDFDENGELLWGINDGEGDDLDPDIFTINPETGEAMIVTTTDDGFESLAVAPPFCGEVVIADVPTLSEWGLIFMAAILGIVGFMVIRRRKVTA